METNKLFILFDLDKDSLLEFNKFIEPTTNFNIIPLDDYLFLVEFLFTSKIEKIAFMDNLSKLDIKFFRKNQIFEVSM